MALPTPRVELLLLGVVPSMLVTTSVAVVVALTAETVVDATRGVVVSTSVVADTLVVSCGSRVVAPTTLAVICPTTLLRHL